MNKFLASLLIISALCLTSNLAQAEEYTLNAGVTVNDIPKAFFGSWRVSAKLESSDSPRTFKPTGVDLWNLSRSGDIITLSNPFSGASAEISIRTAESNLIVFSKKAPYDNKILTDTVAIRLGNNSFTGINDLVLESYSNIDNRLIKTEHAKYVISGEKISGESVLRRE